MADRLPKGAYLPSVTYWISLGEPAPRTRADRAAEEETMATTDQNKQLVARLFEAFRAGDTSRFDGLIAVDYKQHNPQAGDGLAAVKAFFGPVGPVDVTVYRVIAEGDLVAVHAQYRT